jgi:hypothetical protein
MVSPAVLPAATACGLTPTNEAGEAIELIIDYNNNLPNLQTSP